MPDDLAGLDAEVQKRIRCRARLSASQAQALVMLAGVDPYTAQSWAAGGAVSPNAAARLQVAHIKLTPPAGEDISCG